MGRHSHTFSAVIVCDNFIYYFVIYFHSLFAVKYCNCSVNSIDLFFKKVQYTIIEKVLKQKKIQYFIYLF